MPTSTKTTLTNVEVERKLNSYSPRPYQLPVLKALDDGFKRVLAILPRRAGKDITALNYVIRQMWENPGVYYYIFPTYSQAKKVIWDSMTNDGKRILDYFPQELVVQKNSQEMKIRMQAKNGQESLFQLVGSDNYDCFDEETEILTQNGWRLFKDLQNDDKVGTLNSQGIFEWQTPTSRMVYDYDGEMYCVENSSMNFCVTPNHRFYVRSSKGVYKFKRIDDATIVHDSIPAQCKWIGESPDTILGYDSKEFMCFLGLYLSEGSTFSNHKCYRVIISQTKPSVRSEIKRILDSMGLRYCEHKDGFSIENKQLYEYCSSLGKQNKRFIPTDILNLSKEHLHLLFEYLVLGDGHRCDTYIAYYSTSKRLVDQVQEIIIKLGLSGNIRVKHSKGYTSTIRERPITAQSDLYEIRVRFSKFKRLQGAASKKYLFTRHYNGKIYCVSVPNQVIKVRRKGFEMWSGNSLMGTNPRGVVFSEYALQDPRAYQYIRPILTANKGWALFISTPRGKNHLWTLAQLAQQSPEWFYYKLSVEDTHHIPLEEIEKERREGLMSEDMIQQEYYTSFEMGVEGAYYSKYIDQAKREQRIGDVPWENGFKVHTAWDLGVRDSTCIIFFQSIGQTIRIIDCYENSKEGLEHYVEVLQNKPYVYGTHIAPHDIRVKEWGSGLTRIEKARQLGIKFTIADDIDIPDGIEAVRSLLGKVWFDEKKTGLLIKALENYRQEYDVKKKVYKRTPLHDWSSHFSDAMRYLAIGMPKTRDGLSKEELEKRYQKAYYGTEANLPPMFRNDPYNGSF